MSEPSFDWASFFALFWNDKGIKCKVNVPDTVIFRYGQLSAWWATAKDGTVQRHASQNTTIESIRKRFIQVANEDEANYSKFVTISRHGDGRPQLLRPQAFNQLCELLSDRLECGHPDTTPEIETPSVLQAFIQPYQDLRYITTLINDGKAVSCHTFQRKYSRRYAAMSATAAAATDTAQDVDVILDDGVDGEARRAEVDHQMGAVDPALKMQLRKLTAHLVRYIQRAHNLTLGGIVCEYVRDVSGKVWLLSVLRTEWASNAAGGGAGSLSAAALMSEPTEQPGSEEAAALLLIEEDGDEGAVDEAAAAAALEAEWRRGGVGPNGEWTVGGGEAQQEQQATGYGGAYEATAGAAVASPSGNGAMAQQAHPGFGLGGSGQWRLSGSGAGTPAGAVGPRPATAGAAGYPLTPTGAGGGGGGSTRSSLAQFPGGQGRGGSSTPLGGGVSNTWPSLQHHESSPVLGSPAAHPNRPAPELSASFSQQWGSVERQRGAGGGAAYARAQSADLIAHSRGVAGAGQQQRPARVASARPASSNHNNRISFGRAVPSSPAGTAGLGGGGLPPRAASPSAAAARSRSPIQTSAAAAVVSIVSASGAHVNGGVRGAPLLLHQLQREVEALRDEVAYQHQMAEAGAAKIRQLEHEKAVSTGAFSSRSNELNHLLSTASESLEGMRSERDAWRQRAEVAEARVAELEAVRGAMEKTLNDERATVMKLMKEFHDKEESRSTHTEQLEAEVSRLSEQLKAEAVASNALKRQLLQYSDIAERYKSTIKDGNIEAGMEEVLERIGHLFSSQANPTGEQYAVQKVLCHYQSDLRSVFLFYTQLDASFTEHWPPSLSFAQWMLYCKDSQTSDIRAGARIRSNIHALMLTPSECESIFFRYSKADWDAATPSGGGRAALEAQVLSYETYLASLVHAASRLMRPEVPFLSEGVREYIIKYVSRAEKVSPTGGAGSRRGGPMRAAIDAAAAAEAARRVSGPGGGGAGQRGGGGGNGQPGGHKGKRAHSAAPTRAKAAGVVGAGEGGGGAATSDGTTTSYNGGAGTSATSFPGSAGAAGAAGAATVSARAQFSGPDSASAAVARELSMLGLSDAAGGAVRRGGGFDLGA